MTRPDNNGPVETLGERLKRVLEEEGMSQRQLAMALAGTRAPQRKIENVRRQVVRWANDQATPEAPTARRLAAVLRKPTDYFTVEESTQTVSAALESLAQEVALLRGDLLALRDRVRALEDLRPPRGRR